MARVIFLFILLISFPTYAQLGRDHYKVKKTQQILERVGLAFGIDQFGELPLLVMYAGKSSSRIAYFEWRTEVSNRNRLLLDEKLFDICARVDKGTGDALAFVIAHEIAHFKLHHERHQSFAEVPRNKNLNSPTYLNLSVQRERDADQTGIHYAYIAGFDPKPVLDALFDSLYANYGLSENLNGYPSKANRKASTNVTASEFLPSALLFWIGQTLLCRGYMEEAYSTYEKILTGDTKFGKSYNFPEVYNNLGVIRLQQALLYTPNPKIRKFALPVEIDPQNRLLLQEGRGETIDQTLLAEELLQKAENLFARAIALDPNYKVAYINRAIVWLLRKNYSMSLGYLDELRKKFSNNLPSSWWTIHGITMFASENNTKADELLSQAVRLKATNSTFNKLVFQSLVYKKTQPNLRVYERLIGCRNNAPLFKEIDTIPDLSKLKLNYLIQETAPSPFLSIGWIANSNKLFLEIILKRETLYFSTLNANL